MRKGILLLSFFLPFLLSGSSAAEIVQHFDSSGNLLPEAKEKAPAPLRSAQKYSAAQSLSLLPGVRYEFYPVFGRTFAEIVKSAEENGPFDTATRRRRTSAFAWAMGWSYEFSYRTEYDEEHDKLHCDISLHDVSLSYDITITLPVLTDDSSLNEIEKDLWKGYVARILETEHGRVKIVREDAREDILRHLEEIDYLMLDAEQEAAADGLIARYVRDQTARVGRDTARQIRERLAQYDTQLQNGSGDAPGRREGKKQR
jgi:predicted secreted Zn-dependent protease